MDNVVADALSRIEMNAFLDASPPQVDLAAMAKAQYTDPELSQILSSPSSSSLTLNNIPLSSADGTIMYDTSTGVHRPFVPAPLHCIVFDSLYSLSHPEIRCNPTSSYSLVCLAQYQ